MRLSKRKLLLLLISVPFLAAVVWFSYQAYHSYADYTRDKDKMNYTTLLESSRIVLKSIADEELESALYIASGYAGTAKNKRLTSSRNSTDRALHIFGELLSSHKEFSAHKSRVSQLQESVGLARSQVDTLSRNYKGILFDSYYKSTKNILSGLSIILAEKYPSKVISGTLKCYQSIEEIFALGALERSFVALKIATKSPLSESDLLLWESILGTSTLGDYSGIADRSLLGELNRLLKNKQIDNAIDNARIVILKDAASGDYTLTVKKWCQEYTQLLKNIGLAQKTLLTNLKKRLSNMVKALESQAIEQALYALVLFLFMAIIISVFLYVSKDDELLEKTLKNIEFNLTKDKRDELRSVVAGKNDAEIYDFLGKIITEANQTKDLFLANMSHEIRTPLNGIVGFSDILKESGLREDQEEYMDVIRESSDNLLIIVNDILDLSKIKADKMELEHISFHTHERFDAAVEPHIAKANTKDISYSFFIDPRLPPVLMGDYTKIAQILTNLIGNAMKFTSKRGEVNVAIEKLSEEEKFVTIQFSIEDTGVGISEEQKSRIFDEFSQVDSSTSRKFGGTGLGLAISSKMIALMGGELKIDSVLGEGARFYFALTMEKGVSEETEKSVEYPDLSVGLVLPTRDIKKQANRNIESYVRFYGAEFKIYYGDEIFILDDGELPDLLFVDYAYAQRENELKKLTDIDTKVALLTERIIKNEPPEVMARIVKVIAKPVNFTKIKTLLEEITQVGEESIVPVAPERLRKDMFRGMKALVAEDNLINQKLIAKILSDFGVTVSIANNGKEAITMRKNSEYHIIFMDIQMPVLGGIDASRQIIEYEKRNDLAHVPIIALTANALQGDKEKYLKEGMDDYASKPIDVGQLRLILEHFSSDIELLAHGENSEEGSGEADQECTLVESSEVTIDIDQIDEERASKGAVLLYRNSSLVSKITKHVIEQFDYQVDIALSEQEFTNAVLDKKYNYVFIDGIIAHNEGSTLMGDLIEGTGAEVVIFTNTPPDNFQAYDAPLDEFNPYSTISENIDKKELAQVLK